MRGITTYSLITGLAGALLFATAGPVEAQFGGIGDRIRNSVENAAGRELGNAAADATTTVIRCALGDERCAQEARDSGQTPVFEDPEGNVVSDSDGNPITDPQDAAAAAEQPGEGVWRNYDFVPGSEVWYAMDLADERIGRIPVSQIEFVEGNMQLVEIEGENAIEFSSESVIQVRLPEVLPDDFTIEFDYRAAAPNAGLTLWTGPAEGINMRTHPYHYVSLAQRSGIDFQGNAVSELNGFWNMNEEFVPIAIQVDGEPDAPDYVIGYAGVERFGQVPNAEFERSDLIQFRIRANDNLRAYLKNIVVAVHGEPLNDALATTGEVVTRGILFDVDSDRIRGESTPTLNEILSSLERHEELSVAIEGHTDGQGDDDYNLELSQRRAEAVVEYLAVNGIDPGRLTAVGRGETEPVADNATEAGRQQNRRVVIRAQ